MQTVCFLFFISVAGLYTYIVNETKTLTLSAFSEFHSIKSFCNSAAEQGKSICFQSVSLDEMPPAIPQQLNGNFIPLQCVPLDEMFRTIPQWNKGISSTLNHFQSRKCFPQFRCPAIPQRNNETFICFQSIPLERMFPLNAQRNNRNLICFPSVPLANMLPVILQRNHRNYNF